MAEKNTNQANATEKARFTAFLKDNAQRSKSLADWELRMLGGFGGYQSQARAQSPQNQQNNPTELK